MLSYRFCILPTGCYLLLRTTYFKRGKRLAHAVNNCSFRSPPSILPLAFANRMAKQWHWLDDRPYAFKGFVFMFFRECLLRNLTEERPLIHRQKLKRQFQATPACSQASADDL